MRHEWRETGFRLAVDGFAVAPGERVLLVGESGGGKSTLLSLACGVLRADAGRVLVEGTDLGALREAARDRLRAERFGVIFQMFNLLPFATALDNVLLPLRFAKRRRAQAGREEARALLDRLRVPEDAWTAKAARLSVGQQQRVAAARALIGAPALVLADEPTSALDPATAAEFMDLLRAELARTGATLLMVSHDPALASHFDRTVRLSDVARAERRAAA